MPSFRQIRLNDAPVLVLVLGFGVASIAIVGERVYVTRLIANDALRRRCGLSEHLDLSWTKEVHGYERETVLRWADRSGPRRIGYVPELVAALVCVLVVVVSCLIVGYP